MGALGALAAGALLVAAVLSPPRDWSVISSLALGLVLLWLFVVRPCARIRDDGIELVNPLRNVDLTWPAIQEVRSRWALELVVRGRRYTAWGVPADPGRPRHGRRVRAFGSDAVASGSVPPARHAKVDAQTAAAEIEALIAADRRRTDRSTPGVARQSWDVLSVALLVSATAFFVYAVFVA